MTRFLVTGVNRGIGAALASEARALGHEVIGTTRDGRDGTIALELSKPDTIAAQLKDVPPFDVLINNAGILGADPQSPLDIDADNFAQVLAVNSIAPLMVAQAVLPRLRESKAGKILTISSQMSWMGYRKSNLIGYRASKAAVNKAMQGLASALEADNIPVALIDPGWVRTDMGGAEADESPMDVAKGVLAISENLSLKDTGKFFRFSGEEREF